MEQSTNEYDSLLGGKYSLPDTLNIMRFSAARSKEIEEVRQSLKKDNSVKLAFQKLPKHMRRRVMSHNAKRLPRRLREIHLSQLTKSGMPPKQKRPSRKFRRRPRNIVENFARRKNRNAWLETHIWHAKRFHMIEKWGYKIPDRPCDKSFRACYRASSKHCLLQDISYYSCIELSGNKELLIKTLRNLCKPNEGLSIGAKVYISGRREGSTTFYDVLNDIAIGKVLFNWKPESDILWLWAHAAYYGQILKTLISVFHLKETSEGYRNDNNVILLELKGELNRFRLTGPLSHSVLLKSLKMVNLYNTNSKWLKSYLENDDSRQNYAEQLDYWKNISTLNSPALLSPHIVLSLIVVDPRYNYPTKRTKAIPDNRVANIKEHTLPGNIGEGAIWDRSIRLEVKESKVTNAIIDRMRSELLVPGTEMETPGAPVPVLLIQRPGKANSGFCSGWDIIIPSGWAQPFWMCFIMYGARAGGLRESDSIDFEMGEPNFLQPDTQAGEMEDEQISIKSTNKFFKLPPNKRTNYNKFSIASPLKLNWKLLTSEWQTSPSENFFVLRDKHILETIKCALETNKLLNANLQDNCLVPVKLVLKRGVLKTFSIICLPNVEDLKSPPTEAVTADGNQAKRKELRTSHKALLKRLSKKRRAARQLGKKIEINAELLKNYRNTMRELWLPSEVTNIRHSCSRQVMGLVTKGGFSLVSGQSCAVGYVSVGSLCELVKQKIGNKVLVRNTNCRQYRLAVMEVVM